jgi:hypothetical protein
MIGHLKKLAKTCSRPLVMQFKNVAAKASTLAKASEKAYLIHWTDEVIQRPSVPGHRTKR